MTLTIEQKQQAKQTCINQFDSFCKQVANGHKYEDELEIHGDLNRASKLTKKYWAAKVKEYKNTSKSEKMNYIHDRTNKWIRAYVRKLHDIMMNIHDDSE